MHTSSSTAPTSVAWQLFLSLSYFLSSQICKEEKEKETPASEERLQAPHQTGPGVPGGVPRLLHQEWGVRTYIILPGYKNSHKIWTKDSFWLFKIFLFIFLALSSYYKSINTTIISKILKFLYVYNQISLIYSIFLSGSFKPTTTLTFSSINYIKKSWLKD